MKKFYLAMERTAFFKAIQHTIQQAKKRMEPTMTTSQAERPFVSGIFYCLRVLLFIMSVREPPGVGFARNTFNCALTNPSILGRLLLNCLVTGKRKQVISNAWLNAGIA
jgi:hypothetical protein